MNSEIHTFYSPTKTIFGVGASKSLENELIALNQKTVILITDTTVREIEAADELISRLSSSGFDVKIFVCTVGEPTLDILNPCVEFVREQERGMVIGLGGGSVMDQAKIASAMATNRGGPEDFVGVNKIPEDGLPLVLIPTTSGTGSEVSKNAIVQGKDGKKLVVVTPKIIPSVALVDPLFTLSLPPRPTAFTGMDALSHAIEAMLSLNCHAMTRAVALEAISLINENLALAHSDGSNIQARYNMCLAATLGGLSLNSGVILGHSVAYTLAHLGLSHGIGCAVALPHIMKFNAPAAAEKLRAVARAFGLYDSLIDDPTQAAAYAVDAVRRLNERFDIPLSLENLEVDRQRVKDLAVECFTKYPRPSNPRKYTQEDIVALYDQLWSGDLDFHQPIDH